MILVWCVNHLRQPGMGPGRVRQLGRHIIYWLARQLPEDQKPDLALLDAAVAIDVVYHVLCSAVRAESLFIRTTVNSP